MTMNWTWLMVALPAGGAGFLLGAVLRRRWEDNSQEIRRIGRACILVAIAAWSAAFFNIVPLASNAIALVALAARVGLYHRGRRTSTRAVDPSRGVSVPE